MIVSLFLANSVLAAPYPPFPGMCDMNFTDQQGETHSADDWCTNCPDGPYDFCVGDDHYQFGCVSNGPRCNCDRDNTFSESCPGGCDNWDCAKGVGCTWGECIEEEPGPLPCAHYFCQEENEVGCICGTAETTASARWCCSNDNFVASSKSSCQTSPSCAVPGNGGNGNGNGDGNGGGANGGISIGIDNPLNATSFEALINSVINFIFIVALAIAPLMIIIAGFYFITAAGNPQKIDIAKRIILYTAIGLAIVLFAKGLIALLQKAIGG